MGRPMAFGFISHSTSVSFSKQAVDGYNRKIYVVQITNVFICLNHVINDVRMKSIAKFGPVIPGVRELKMLCYDDIKRMKR